MRIYLAGGLKNDWQEEATHLLRDKDPEIDVLNPRVFQSRNLSIEEIADIEREWILNADVVLAFLEKDNPLPMGLCAELGFANALGKKTLLVDEYKNHKSKWLAQFTESDVYSSLSEAINALFNCHQFLTKN